MAMRSLLQNYLLALHIRELTLFKNNAGSSLVSRTPIAMGQKNRLA